jgi:nitroreductase
LAPRLAGRVPADDTERRTLDGVVRLVTTFADVPVIVFVCGRAIYPPGNPSLEMMYSATFAASQNLVLAARALGLGAAFTTLHNAMPGLREFLGIPEDRTVTTTIPLGWPAQRHGPLTRRPLDQVVHCERWSG